MQEKGARNKGIGPILGYFAQTGACFTFIMISRVGFPLNQNMGLDIYTGGEGKSIQHVIFFPHNKTHALHNKDNRKHKYAPHKRNKKHKLKQRYKTELQLVVYK
jgi:hypothetical protein